MLLFKKVGYYLVDNRIIKYDNFTQRTMEEM